MNRRLTVLGLLCTVALAGLIGTLTAGRLDRARNATDSAHARVEEVSARLGELDRLREAIATVEASRRPNQDLIARAQDALALAGLPGSHLRDVVSNGDVAIDQNEHYRRQRVDLTLAELDLAALGRLLDTWVANQPTWSVERLELSHTGAAAPVYDVRLGLAATYVDRENQ